jgi:hypothetical protein
MNSFAPLDRLQKIADFRTTSKMLMKSGKQGIMFGVVFLVLGAMSFDDHLYDWIYLGIGMVELLIGMRNRFHPSAFGVVLDGIMLLLWAVFNLSMQVVIVNLGGDLHWFSTLIGVLIINVGLKRILRYRRAREAFVEPPTPEQLQWFDELIAEIQEADAAATPDLVVFKAGFPWKGKRLGDTVIFVDKLDTENLIVDRRDIDIEDKGKAIFSNSRLVKLRIGQRRFGVAEFTPAMLALLELWRTEGAAGPNDENEPEMSE